MSGKTPEEGAGYARFTAILPSDTLQKIDILKAFSKSDSRNHVIRDAIDLLDHVSGSYGIFAGKGKKATEADHSASTNNIEDYVRTSLTKYWSAYADFYNKRQ